MRKTLTALGSCFLLLTLAGCGGSAPTPATPTTPAPGAQAAGAKTDSAPAAAAGPTERTPQERTEEGGLKILDREVGKGKEAKSGDMVSVHYVGTLDDGYEFDSSRKRGKPIEIPIGEGRVIKGWDRGIVGMKEGGKRRLVIPYQLAYGEDGRPPKIPPRATLTFEVELVEVKSK
jgi:peptidylprolyl isomerase